MFYLNYPVVKLMDSIFAFALRMHLYQLNSFHNSRPYDTFRAPDEQLVERIS